MPQMRSRRCWPGIAIASILAWVGIVAEPALAQDGVVPARGHFLVATRQVQDPMFGGSVILLFHAGQGAMGLIVNRQTGRRLGELAPDDPTLRERDDLVFLGGPVEAAALIVLLRDAAAREGTIVGDVRAAIRREEVEDVLGDGAATGPIRFYAGHAGWAPGQLEHEIARGDWLVVDARPEQVFAKEPAELWPDLIRRHEGIRVEAPRPHHAPYPRDERLASAP